MQDISCSSSTISQQGANLTSFSHLMSPTSDLGKTQILQQNFHVEMVVSRREQPKSGGGVKVHPPPLAVRKQNSELQSTRQTASAGFFKAFQSKAANQQMLVSQINRNIFGDKGSSRGSNTIEPPDLLHTSKDTKVAEKKRDNQNVKCQPFEISSNAQRRQQRSLITSRRNSKEQVTYPLPQSRDEQAVNESTTSSSKRGHESSIISPPSTASEQQQQASNYLNPLTREISSRGRIFSQQSSANSQATESFIYPGSKSSSRRVIGVHGLLPSIEGSNQPQVQSQQVSSRVLRDQKQTIDEDFRSYQSVKISKNLSKPPTSRQAQGKHSIIISAPVSPPNEALDNSFFDSSQMSIPHSQINQTLEESMIMGGGQKPFKPQQLPTYLPVNRKRPVQQYPMSVGPKEPKQLAMSERGTHGESLHQWKHQTMAPSTVISQTKANDQLMFNDGNDISTNYLTIDDTIPNTTGLYALKQVGVGFENQGRAVSIDRSQRVKKESSMADFSSLSLVTKPSHHNVRQKVNSNLSTAQSMTANHHYRPSFVFSPERPSQNIEALSNYQSLASLAYMQKGQQKGSEGEQAPRVMLETGSFPSTQQHVQTFGQQNLMVPQINFQNLVLSPQMQKELFFSPSMIGQISHQRQLSFNEDVLKDLPSYQGASQQSPSQPPVLQPMIYLPPPVTALPIYGNSLGVTDEEQDSLLQAHKRSNSQGSYDQQLKKRPLKQRGLAQKIVLPKNSSFLAKSGLTNAIGSQAFDPSNQQSANAAAAVLANLNQRKLNSGITGGLPLKDMTESHINVIQVPQVINNSQPQCIINFNISFGCFPKQEQYKQYRNEKTPQGCFSPERSEKPTSSESTMPDWLKPSPACELPNTSELLLGKKQASTGSSENAKPSSLTNLSTTDYITKRYSGPDLTTSSGNYSPFSPEQSTAGKYQSKLIQEVKCTPQHEIEEMRKNIKTPCFNSGGSNQCNGNFHHSAATDIKQPSAFL